MGGISLVSGNREKQNGVNDNDNVNARRGPTRGTLTNLQNRISEAFTSCFSSKFARNPSGTDKAAVPKEVRSAEKPTPTFASQVGKDLASLAGKTLGSLREENLLSQALAPSVRETLKGQHAAENIDYLMVAQSLLGKEKEAAYTVKCDGRNIDDKAFMELFVLTGGDKATNLSSAAKTKLIQTYIAKELSQGEAQKAHATKEFNNALASTLRPILSLMTDNVASTFSNVDIKPSQNKEVDILPELDALKAKQKENDFVNTGIPDLKTLLTEVKGQLPQESDYNAMSVDERDTELANMDKFLADIVLAWSKAGGATDDMLEVYGEVKQVKDRLQFDQLDELTDINKLDQEQLKNVEAMIAGYYDDKNKEINEDRGRGLHGVKELIAQKQNEELEKDIDDLI